MGEPPTAAQGDATGAPHSASSARREEASLRVPRTPASRAKGLRIDTNVPDNGPGSALASPLAILSSRKPPANSQHLFREQEVTADRRSRLSSPFLEYGMIISLVSDGRDGIICAEGFASCEVRLENLGFCSELGVNEESEKRPTDFNRLPNRIDRRLGVLSCPFHDCLFEVVPKMTYDATSALQGLVGVSHQHSRHIHHRSSSSVFSGVSDTAVVANLRFKSEAEARLNSITYRKLKGTRVLYGQTLQLRHVKTGDFMCLEETSFALRGTEHKQVYLEGGSARAHFTIMPRFKLRAKGAPVQMTDQLLLTSENTGQLLSLHASNGRNGGRSACPVVGSTNSSTPWRAILFEQPTRVPLNTHHQIQSEIRAGCCVRLLHLESSCLLQYDAHLSKDPPMVSLCFHDYEGLGGTDEDLVGCLSAESIWMVERSSLFDGGEILWKDSLCLRHLLTGKYLALEDISQPQTRTVRSSPASSTSPSNTLRIGASAAPEVFSLFSTATTDFDAQVLDASVALIQHSASKSFVHSPETHASSMADIRLSSIAFGSRDNSGSTFSVVALQGARDEDAFKIMKVLQAEVDDTLLLMSYKKALKNFIVQFDGVSNNKKNCDMPVPARFLDRDGLLATMVGVEDAATSLIRFCHQGKQQSSRVHRLRQSMFQAHGYIDLLLDMIKAPFDCFGGPLSIDFVTSFNTVSNASPGRSDDPSFDLVEDIQCVKSPDDFPGNEPKLEAEVLPKSNTSILHCIRKTNKEEPYVEVMQAITRVIRTLNVLLVQIFSGHRANEVYVAQNAMPMLMELLGNGFQTSLPLSHLLRENRNLVESITGCGGIIRSFFDLIKSRGRSIRYMQFLVALCVSHGHGVPKTQEAICELLFNASNGYRDFVIVPIRATESGFEVFIGPRGSRQVNAAIDVTAHSNGEWIGLVALYQGYYVNGKHPQLCQYCYGLLQLYVALCLDRNYVSIDYVQRVFPRDALLQVVQDVALSRTMRSVLFDLLRVSYIDCEPQKAVACPNYTRIWADVGVKECNIELPKCSSTGYSSADIAFFGSLRIACLSYLTGLHGRIIYNETPQNQLTLAVVKICKKMVEFGMYSSQQDLINLVGSLVDLLDNRSDSLDNVGCDAASLDAWQRGGSHFDSLCEGSLSFERSREPFTNMPASSPFAQDNYSSDRFDGGHNEDLDGEAPLLKRLRNSALMDGASTLVDRDGAIARQYGTNSLIWKEHCTPTGKFISHNGNSTGHVVQVSSSGIQHSRQSLICGTRSPESEPNRSSQYVPQLELKNNHTVLEMKDEICAVLQLVDSMRLDYQISTFLVALRSQSGPAEIIESTRFADVFNNFAGESPDAHGSSSHRLPHRSNRLSMACCAEPSSPIVQLLFSDRPMDCKYSLSRLGGRNVNSVLMQVLMYEYPPLVSKALDLWLQQFYQHDQLLYSLLNLQLLVTDKSIAIYNRLKDDVDELRRLSETTEVWMDLTSTSDFENAEWACNLLRSIRVVVTTHTKHQLGGNGAGGTKLPQDHVPAYASKPGSVSYVLQRRASSGFAAQADSAPSFTKRRDSPNCDSRLHESGYCELGKVSYRSGCHELLPMAKLHAVEFHPPRKVRSHSAAATMAQETLRLLRNLKAAEYVIDMIDDGAHYFEAHAKKQPNSPELQIHQVRQKERICEVFQEALRFLCAFCEHDPENQALLTPYTKTIANFVSDFEIAQKVLVSIYATNPGLCKAVPAEVVNTFVIKLIHEPLTPRYLFFLESIVLCGEGPVQENQLLVLYQIIKYLDNGHILQFFDDPMKSLELFTALFIRYRQAIARERQFCGTDLTDSAQSNHKHDEFDGSKGSRFMSSHGSESYPVSCQLDARCLEYHVRLLHLFAACATGGNARGQEICQQMIPLGVSMRLLLLDSCTEGMQFALLRFILEVYLSSDDSRYLENKVQDVLEALVVVVERATLNHIREIHNEDTNRRAVAGLQKSLRLKEAILTTELTAKTVLVSKSLYLVIQGAIPTILGLLRQQPLLIESACLEDDSSQCMKRLFLSLTALFCVCSVGERCLHDDTISASDELCLIIDRVRQGGRGGSIDGLLPLSTIWREAKSRNLRTDLSGIMEVNSIEDIVLALASNRSAGDRSYLESSDQYPRAHILQSVVRPSQPVSNDKSAAHIGGEHSYDAVLDRLRVVQPIVSTVVGVAHPPKKSLTSKMRSNMSKSCETKCRNSTNTSSKPFVSVLKRRYNKNASNMYSRQSSPAINCSTVAKTSSSMFLSQNLTTAARKYGEGGCVSTGQHRDPFDEIMWRLCSDPRVEDAMRNELNRMVDSILSVEETLRVEYDPRMHMNNIRLTFDQVVAKLVAHVLAFRDANFVKTNLILLDVFCRMIYAADGDWERRHDIQIKLNRLQVTKLVVELISTRDDDAIFERSVELGVALLDGMNAEVQETFHSYWLELPEGRTFFNRLESRIEKACKMIHSGFGDRQPHILSPDQLRRGQKSIHQVHGESCLTKRRSVASIDRDDLTQRRPVQRPSASNHPEDRSSVPQVIGGPMTLIFRFLQLLCEGHYLNAQRFLIWQPSAQDPVNLVEATTSFLLDTYLALADLDVGLVIQLFETITEFCQGPCVEAQNTVANFKFFSAVNALLIHQFADEGNPTGIFLVRRLRASVIVTLLSLLEGRRDRTIHNHLVQELNFDALQTNLVGVYDHFVKEYGGLYHGNMRCSDDFYLEMGFNIYILLRKLADCFPHSASAWIPRNHCNRGSPCCDATLSDTLHQYRAAFHFFQTNSARVEILWNHHRAGSKASSSTTRQKEHNAIRTDDCSGTDGDLVAYYFPLHPICYCLTEQSKKKLVWRVSRGSNKLHDFYARTDKLVDEMAHQSRLQYHPLLAAFARSADLLKRMSFILGVVINLVVLMYYQAGGIESRPYAASRVTFLAPLDETSSEPSNVIKIGLSIAGTLQLILCILIMICYLINSAPLLIKKGWKRRIHAEQEKLSKKKASIRQVPTATDGKETFQDAEQLLRSLREREDEYDYLFLPHRHVNRLQSRPVRVRGIPPTHDSRLQSHPPSRQQSVRSQTVLTLWQQLREILFGSGDGLLRNESIHAKSGSWFSTSVVSTLKYCETIAISIYFLIRTPRVLYFFWQISIAILGSYVNSLFFAFHLLDVVNRYQELSNVLRAIVRPAKVLGVTLLLYLVVVYVFAVVGFFFFRDDYNPSGPLTPAQREGVEPYQCQRLFQCFLISLDQGFKSNGGLGGYLKYRIMGDSARSYSRLVFDLLYNTILMVMLLNIVFGVIIDTFASLREADHEKLVDMQNRCFICSHDAYTFDRSTKGGFHEHIYTEHNMWHYLYLFVHIRKKPITEYNGLELYLAMCMAKRDVSFFPNRRALTLEVRVEDLSTPVVCGLDISDGIDSPHRVDRVHPLPGRVHAAVTDSALSNSSRDNHLCPDPIESPCVWADRSMMSKMEKLESAVEHLLAAQKDLKEQNARTFDRHNKLIHLLETMKESGGLSSTLGSGGLSSDQPSQSLPAENVPVVSRTERPSRRNPLGIFQRSPGRAATSAVSEHLSVEPPNRHTQSPRVFNFDSMDNVM